MSKKQEKSSIELALVHFNERIKLENKIENIKKILINSRINHTPGIFIINEIEKVLDDKTANHNI